MTTSGLGKSDTEPREAIGGLNELHTAVDGDIGMAWGFHTEEFKMKGYPPQKVRVRFTMTLKFERNRWRALIAHRDIQKFDERGYHLLNQ